jgi:hypothetical protein
MWQRVWSVIDRWLSVPTPSDENLDRMVRECAANGCVHCQRDLDGITRPYK